MPNIPMMLQTRVSKLISVLVKIHMIHYTYMQIYYLALARTHAQHRLDTCSSYIVYMLKNHRMNFLIILLGPEQMLPADNLL